MRNVRCMCFYSVVCCVVSALIMAFFSTSVLAAYAVTPRITVDGTYDSNIFLDSENEESDFITSISPGIGFTLLEKNTGVELNYQLNVVRFAENDDQDFVGHTGMLDAWYRAGRNVKFGITDTLIRSNDPLDRFAEEDIRLSRGRSE